MTDKELLELAAKAAGWEITGKYEESHGFLVDCGDASYYWNPLTYDGDALRLFVKLGLFVHSENDRSRTQAGLGPLPGLKSVDHGSDPLAATRRAIVRAAAEIGKAMQ